MVRGAGFRKLFAQHQIIADADPSRRSTKTAPGVIPARQVSAFQ
jgi:hypothetical protein